MLLAHDKYRRVTGRSGLWTIGTARRKFTRATLAKLWTTMTSPELRRETQHAAESVIVGTVAHVFDSIPGFGVTSPTVRLRRWLVPVLPQGEPRVTGIVCVANRAVMRRYPATVR